MKKLAKLGIGLFFMSLIGSLHANTLENMEYYGTYGKSYIFVVDNVEFSVFPDGQFDFTYIGSNSLSISTPNVQINYNSGYDYDMYVQYDIYGAVIQIENVPIYYDEYGRIAQAGDVEIRYNNRRIVRVGGLNIHYNYYGYYTHCTGYINPFNYYYVYQPWHVYYVRPVFTTCIVYDYPYRRYYTPTRYTYYDHHNYYVSRGRSNVAYTNGRRSFYRPGSRIHSENGRTIANRDYNPNRRNTAVSESSKRSLSNKRSITSNDVKRSSNKSEKQSVSRSNTTRIVSNNSSKRSSDTKVRTQKTSYSRKASPVKKSSGFSHTNSKNTKSSSKSTIKRSSNPYKKQTKVATSSSTSKRKSASNKKSTITRSSSSKSSKRALN